MENTTTTDASSSTGHLYPKILHDGTPFPSSTKEIDKICQDIHEACKEGLGGDEKKGRVMHLIGRGTGWGVDEKRIIEAIGPTTGEVRHGVSLRYKELYGEALQKVFKDNLSGDFCEALQLLALSPASAECRIVRKACEGVGTDETLLYSVICGRSNADMTVLKKTYFKEYEKDLSKLMIRELSGDLEKLIFTSMQACEEKFDSKKAHTREKALEFADRLFIQAEREDWFGSGRDGRQSVYTMICSAPPPFLRMADDAYRKKYGHRIFYSIYRAKDASSTCKKAAIFTLGMKVKPAETVAKLIKSACAGIGTDEMLLTSCVIRYQAILKDVGLAHIELFDKTLHARIRSETSGNYKALLLAVLEKMFPEEDTSSSLKSNLLGSSKILPHG